MRLRHSFVLLVPLFLFVLGCTLPITPQVSSGSAFSTSAPAKTMTVQTDTARNQGVLVTGDGARLDVVAFADDGTAVNCVDALSVAALGADGGARSVIGGFRAIVVGTRGDGGPGAWAFDGRKMQAIMDEESGKLTSRLPECADNDGIFRGQLGWVYHVVAMSPDGTLAAGYAQNPKGISRGRVQVDPGTTVGVYWRISKHPARAALVASRARIIGSLDPSKLQNAGRRIRHFVNEALRHALGQLKLFLFGYFDEYLVMVAANGVQPGPNGVWLVNGTDQDNADAVASIGPTGTIVITEATSTQAPNVTPGSMSGTGGSVALGSSLSVSLVLANTQSTLENQGVSVAFYIATTGSFSPSTDTSLGSITVLQAIPAKGSITITPSFTYPANGPSNEVVYVYAVVTNNVSAPADAALVLAYKTPSPQAYGVLVDTYAARNGDPGTNIGIALFEGAGGGNMASVQSTIVPGPGFFGNLDFTTSGLSSGTYYVRITAVAAGGGFVMQVHTPNIAQASPLALAASPAGANNNQALVDAGSVDTYSGPTPTSPQQLAVGPALNWFIASGDQDWFTFTLP
jgi:hypothetical protein